MPRFQYAGLELISQFILSERLGPSPIALKEVRDVTYELSLIEGGNEVSETIFKPGKIFILTDIDLRCEFGCEDVSFSIGCFDKFQGSVPQNIGSETSGM